jgi:hypothetical protein
MDRAVPLKHIIATWLAMGQSVSSLFRRWALLAAASSGSLERLLEVLQQGPAGSVTHDSSGRTTAWHVAASNGHEQVLAVLASYVGDGQPPGDAIRRLSNSTRQGDGRTPLMLAARAGSEGCVKLLLQQASTKYALLSRVFSPTRPRTEI